MKVSQVSISNPWSSNLYSTKKNSNPRSYTMFNKQNNVQFKAKFGAWLGGIAGGVAVVAVALATAPAAVCLLGGGAMLGAVGGDVVEDAVNGKKQD